MFKRKLDSYSDCFAGFQLFYTLTAPPNPRGTVPTQARCGSGQQGAPASRRTQPGTAAAQDRSPRTAAPPLLQTAPCVGQQVSQQRLSPRSQHRAEGARDPYHTPFCEVWGSTEVVLPEGKGGWQYLCGRLHPPPPPLTSVSMGSTSIPFHSSSKWAIGMLGDDGRKPGSSRWKTQWPPRKAGGGRRCQSAPGLLAEPGPGPSAHSAIWLPPVRGPAGHHRRGASAVAPQARRRSKATATTPQPATEPRRPVPSLPAAASTRF